MKHALGTFCLLAGVSFVAATLTMNWLINEDPTESFLKPVTTSEASGEIKNVEFEFYRNKIYLNVHLNSPLTCKEVIERLGITNFVIKDREYIPSCAVVSKSLIQITYVSGVQI